MLDDLRLRCLASDAAFGREPDTGASRKPMPLSRSRSAILTLALGAIVDMSIARVPSRILSNAQSRTPNSTLSTSGASTTNTRSTRLR